jgi:HD-GYP domain-containing protein (c-di-GMP phosphodiesterase class II)
LVSDRPYRKGIEPVEVKNSIREQSGIHFDPQVVDVFLKMDVTL